MCASDCTDLSVIKLVIDGRFQLILDDCCRAARLGGVNDFRDAVEQFGSVHAEGLI